MTETGLIYMLIALTVARLIVHVRPSTLGRLQKMTRVRLLDGVDSVVWAGLVALMLIHFVVRSFYIPSGSMLPTLQINDFILVNKLIYDFSHPVRGDIVVFRPPGVAGALDQTDLIKRVVGLPYDKIEVRDGVLYLNDLPQQESYLPEPIFKNHPPTIVRKGHLFVMGDNRNNSQDSRFVPPGQVPYENLVGRAEILFYPLSRARFFNFSPSW